MSYFGFSIENPKNGISESRDGFASRSERYVAAGITSTEALEPLPGGRAPPLRLLPVHPGVQPATALRLLDPSGDHVTFTQRGRKHPAREVDRATVGELDHHEVALDAVHDEL